jgi:hypothetical protein
MRVLIEDLSPEAICRIEQRMRPGQSSDAGFLDKEERLVDVIERDMQVLSDLSVTPEQISDRLGSIVQEAVRLSISGLGQAIQHSLSDRDRLAKHLRNWWKDGALEEELGLRVQGKYRVWWMAYLGYQECPFEDASGSLCKDSSYGHSDFVVRNMDTGCEIRLPGLAIHLIRDHHFFEGAVSYRVDPAQAAAVLALLPG